MSTRLLPSILTSSPSMILDPEDPLLLADTKISRLCELKQKLPFAFACRRLDPSRVGHNTLARRAYLE